MYHVYFNGNIVIVIGVIVSLLFFMRRELWDDIWSGCGARDKAMTLIADVSALVIATIMLTLILNIPFAIILLIISKFVIGCLVAAVVVCLMFFVGAMIF